MGTEKDLRLGDDERRPVHKMGVRWVEVGSSQHQRSSLCGRLESRWALAAFRGTQPSKAREKCTRAEGVAGARTGREAEATAPVAFFKTKQPLCASNFSSLNVCTTCLFSWRIKWRVKYLKSFLRYLESYYYNPKGVTVTNAEWNKTFL